MEIPNDLFARDMSDSMWITEKQVLEEDPFGDSHNTEWYTLYKDLVNEISFKEDYFEFKKKLSALLESQDTKLDRSKQLLNVIKTLTDEYRNKI